MATDENGGELSEGELEEGELLSSDEEATSADKQPPPTVESSKQHSQNGDQYKYIDRQKDLQQQSVQNEKHKQFDKQENKQQTSNKLQNDPDSEDGEIFSDDEEAAYYPERVKSRLSDKKSSPEKRPTSDVDSKTSDRESSQSRDRHHSRDRDRESWQMSPGSESSKDDKDASSLFFEDREGKLSDEEQEGSREKRRSWDRDRNRDRHYSSPGSRHGRRDVTRERSDDVNRNNRDSSHYSRSGGYSRKGGFTRQRPYGIKSSRFSPYESYTPSQMNTGKTAQQFHMLAEKVASRRKQGLPLLPTPSKKPKFSNLDQFNYPAAPSWYTETVEEWEARKKEREAEPGSVIPTEGSMIVEQPTNISSLMVTDVSSDEEEHKEADYVKPEPLMDIVTSVNFNPPTTNTNTIEGVENSKLRIQDVTVASVSESVRTDPVVSEAPPTIQPKIKSLFELNFEPSVSSLVQPSINVQPAGDSASTGTVPSATPAQADQDATNEAMDTQEALPSLIVTSQSVENAPSLTTESQPALITDSDTLVDQPAIPGTPIAPVIITNDIPTNTVFTTPPPTNPAEVDGTNYQLRPRKSNNKMIGLPSEGTGFRPKISSDSDNEVNYEDYLDQLDQEEEEEDTDDVIPAVFNPLSGGFPLAVGGTVMGKVSSSDQKMSISDLVSGTLGTTNDEEDDPFNEDFPAISAKKSQSSDQSLLSLVGHAKQTEEVDVIGNKDRIRSGRQLHKRSIWKAKQKERDKQKLQALTEKAQITCKYFMNGSCKNGENCQYKHEVGTAQQKKKEFCKFYLQDSCTKGDSCNYYHGDFPCKFFHSKSHCKNGSQCKFSHAPLTPLTRELLASVLYQPLSDHLPSTLPQIIPIHSAPGGDFKIPMLKSGKTTTGSNPDNKQLVISIPKHIATVEDSLLVSIPLSKLPLGRIKYGNVTHTQPPKLGTGKQMQVPPLFANQPAQGICPPVPTMPLPPQSQPIPLFPPKIDPSLVDQPPVMATGPQRKVLLPTPPTHTKITPQEFMRMKPMEYWEVPELSQQQQQLPTQQFPPFVDNAPPPSQGAVPPSFQSWSNVPVNQPPPFQGHPPHPVPSQPVHQWCPPTHETGSTAGTGMEQRLGIGMGQAVPGLESGQKPPGIGMDDPRYNRTDPRRGPDTRRFDHEHKAMLPPDHSTVDQGTHPPWPSSVSPPPPTHHYHHTPPQSQQTAVTNFKTDVRPGLMARPDPTPSLPNLSHGPPPSDPSRIVSGGHMSPPQQFQSFNKVSPVWGKSPEHSTSNMGGASDHVRRVDPRRKYSHLKIKSRGESSQQSSSILKRGAREGGDESSGLGFKIPKLLQNPSTLEKPLDPRDLFGGKDEDTQEYGDYTAPFGTFKSSFFSQSQHSTLSEDPLSSQKFGEITLDADKAKVSTSEENLEEKSDETSAKVPPKNEVPSYFAHLDMGLDSDLKIDSAFGSLSEGGKTASDSEEVKVQDSQARKLPSIFGLGL